MRDHASAVRRRAGRASPGDPPTPSSQAASSCDTSTQRHELGGRRAAVDGDGGLVTGLGEPLEDGTLHLPGIAEEPVRDDSGGRIEQHDVAHRAGFALEDAVEDPGVVRRIAAEQLVDVGEPDAEIPRVEIVLVDVAETDFPHPAVAGGGELVQTVIAAEHERRGAAGAEDAGDQRHAVEVGDAHGVGLGTRRVAQRTEEVEDRRHAELGPGGARVAEARMEGGCEREGDAGTRQRLGDLLRRQGQVDAERAQDVGGTRRRARRPVAVLDDRDTGCRRHDCGHGGDVDGAEAIASGAHDVENGGVDGQWQSGLEDGVAEADDLIDRLALRPQRHQESAQLRRRGRARHDLSHRPGGLRDAEVAPVEKRREDIRPGVQLRHNAEA